MKKKKEELDVDFIGSQEPLTVEEEKALSEFFSKRKVAKEKIAYKSGASGKSAVSQAPKL